MKSLFKLSSIILVGGGSTLSYENIFILDIIPPWKIRSESVICYS